MAPRSRREFLADVGRGMLVAGLGYGTALDLGLAAPSFSTFGDDDVPDSLTFGALEPLVGLLQETPADKLLPLVVARLRAGTTLEQLVAAAALANARTFGGEDYVGFHTLMALAPAYSMAQELPPARRPLPILKVLYRNTNRIQQHGGRASEVLHPVRAGAPLSEGRPAGEALRDAVRSHDMSAAEQTFATIARGTPEAAFNALQFAVQDATEVHRIVLPYRAWSLLEIVGREHAHTMLRQSVRYCVNSESRPRNAKMDEPRTLLPKVMAEHRLDGRAPGDRVADDAWLDALSRALFESTGEQAAGLVGQALADGFAPASIAEAIALAANQLVLRDVGRTEAQAQAGKPAGSVHGDSIGVHGCDAANAWRNIARVSDARNTTASLILGAYQVAEDRSNRGGDFLHWAPRPTPEQLAEVKAKEAETLLRETEAAIRANDQAHATAAVHRAGELGHPARPIFDLLLAYAVSEEGALHAEKFYRTVADEFATARPAFRWRHLDALARVTASEYGTPAAGHAEACALLGV